MNSKKEVMRNVLENAKFSIQLGIEDYQLSIKDKKRRISAIRNIYAGLLILYKYKLIECSPNDEPFKYIDASPKYLDNNNLPNKTVNFNDIKRVFKQLDIEVSKEHEQKLKNINKHRNDIEHLKIPEEEFLIAVLNDSFVLLDEFYSFHINGDGGLSHFIGENLYQVFLNNKTVFDNKKTKCINSFYGVSFPNKEIEKKY